MMRIALVLAVAVLVCAPTCSKAQLILSDPNTPEAVAERKADAPTVDERLAQKISYTATDKRLSVVLAELSALSGVAVRCGRNRNDWPVRDIPVVVCARDIELGRLLQSIAESAHLDLSSTAINDVILYRISRGADTQQMMADYQSSLYEYEMALVEREWSFWTQLGGMSDSDWKEAVRMTSASNAKFESLGIDTSLRNSSARAFGELVNSVTPETKQKLLAGERIVWAVSDLPKPLADAVATMVRNEHLQHQKYQEKHAREHAEATIVVPDLGSEDIGKARVELWLDQDGRCSLRSRLRSPKGGRSPAVELPYALRESLAEQLPPKPKRVAYPTTKYSETLKAVSDDLSRMPALQTEIKIERPSDAEHMRFRDLLLLLSDASGFTVVSEDFKSHNKYSPMNSVNQLLGEETTLGQLLQKLNFNHLWYVDEKNKLIVGSSRQWCEDHTSLAPVSLLDYIKARLDGDGVYLDDAVMLLRLSKPQLRAWVEQSSELRLTGRIGAFESQVNSMWSFYDSLLDTDKALAKSETGLPLGKFDHQYVAGLLKSVTKGLLEDWREEDAEELATYQRLTHPDVLSRLTMRLTRLDAGRYVTVIQSKPGDGVLERREEGPAGIARHCWRMLIEGPDISIQIPGLAFAFPIYSPERELEIWQENQKQISNADGPVRQF